MSWTNYQNNSNKQAKNHKKSDVFVWPDVHPYVNGPAVWIQVKSTGILVHETCSLWQWLSEIQKCALHYRQARRIHFGSDKSQCLDSQWIIFCMFSKQQTLRLHSGYILTIFWLPFDYIRTTFWLQSDYILATFWLHFDYILTTFGLHSDGILTTI